MSNTLDEGMLIRHMDLRRVAKTSGDAPSRLAIHIEHMDGTNYTVSVVDKNGASLSYSAPGPVLLLGPCGTSS